MTASIPVRVKPGARRNRVGESYPGPLGQALIIEVQASAVDGAATEAVRRALAEALDVPSSSVTLRSGQTSRNKVFRVSPAPVDLEEWVRRVIQGVP
jgi:uncharacterized protein YggU (UPF0235/DUF167 family)